jgi:hypothetical protein
MFISTCTLKSIVFNQDVRSMNASQLESLAWLKTVFDTQLQPFMDAFLPGVNFSNIL